MTRPRSRARAKRCRRGLQVRRPRRTARRKPCWRCRSLLRSCMTRPRICGRSTRSKGSSCSTPPPQHRNSWAYRNRHRRNRVTENQAAESASFIGHPGSSPAAQRRTPSARTRSIARRPAIFARTNLGDIIIDEGDIFGDGVNRAARLEALAEPGGICVSRVVRDQVRDRLDIALEDMGERQVKNTARPVHTYQIALGRTRRAKAETPAPLLALPGKPSIAVLPFQNMAQAGGNRCL